VNSRSAMQITLPADVWGRIVFAAQESDDWRLRTLIEQAVYEAGLMEGKSPAPGLGTGFPSTSLGNTNGSSS